MSAQITTFSSAPDAEFYTAVKQALEQKDIFDSVTIGGTDPLVCKINDVTVFKVASNGGLNFYDTSGNAVYSTLTFGGTGDCVVALADNSVTIMAPGWNSGYGYNVVCVTLGKNSTGAWWASWATAYQTDNTVYPHTAYFADLVFRIAPQFTPTTGYGNVTQAIPTLTAHGDYDAVEVQQIIVSQAGFPRTGSGTLYCYKLQVGTGKYITDGWMLIPYTD